MIVSAQYLYWLAGALLLAGAAMILRDAAHPRRLWAALFWADLGVLFIAGDRMPPALAGAQVLLLTAIAACGGLRHGSTRRLPEKVREAAAMRLGPKLLIPALAIPAITLLGSLAFGDAKIGSLFVLDRANSTLAALGVGCVVALGIACWLTRESVTQAVRQSRELTDVIGWTLVLPQMLAMLGAMFQHTGVGKAIAVLAEHYAAVDVRWIAVAIYCIGMAIFSMIMGGGFASFPLMAGGVGVPALIGTLHGDPAVVAALGMFSAYAGVLVTPMAAHFNLIPAALLELPDRYGVIKAQAPTAMMVLVVNMVLLYYLM
ncbi:hypothetical protein R69927_07514 [Paraburkholderia domus]|uniref:DUF979 domain-containing protein n=1 Tax=Paraburkholderia domus TaxID=2793075 RepID=UPI0019132F1B|nr:DUF979 domain-containing protein [Paraburkholderia domus]MBK5091537.1 DUF979 domain-containing protein [Burkholderia sp. R-69927]CAE6937678.1 hypothetical protein R69927_07514 [Paraburkholderia domus]